MGGTTATGCDATGALWMWQTAQMLLSIWQSRAKQTRSAFALTGGVRVVTQPLLAWLSGGPCCGYRTSSQGLVSNMRSTQCYITLYTMVWCYLASHVLPLVIAKKADPKCLSCCGPLLPPPTNCYLTSTKTVAWPCALALRLQLHVTV